MENQQIPINNINFSNIISENENNIDKYNTYLKSNYTSLYNKEKTITQNLNLKANKEQPKNLEVDILLKQFSNVMINIIDDIIKLFSQNHNLQNNLDIYLYYIRNIINIITNKGRIFFVGIFFILISILLSFIEITS
jgi:hypothetical protein